MKMNRRELVAAAALLPIGHAQAAQGGAPSPAEGASDGYFLSSVNPIANRDQRDLEALALRLFERADVKAARANAKVAWARVTDHLMPPEQMARFDGAMSDYCFKCVLVAAASDADYPKVLRVYSPAAHWFGQDVPASKWGGDNPDNAYRIIPIAEDGRYEVHGQRSRSPSTYVTFQIVGDSSTSVTLGSLEQRDMAIEADGRYVLTLDATPAAGRPNHLRIPPGAMYLFVRDSMGDWATQAPDRLRVRRLNPPSRPPLGDDELARRAIHNIRMDVYYAYYAGRLFFNSPQVMSTPVNAGASGGLVTQIGSLGHFTIGDDEAVVITAVAGVAAYRNIVLHDLWLRSLEYRDHQSSLNNAQMAADADGRFTYVIAPRDPGVHNWLDPVGLHDLLVLHRWQGFPAAGGAAPAIESRIVKLAALDSALPPGVRRLSAEGRLAQLAARRASYDRRFVEA